MASSTRQSRLQAQEILSGAGRQSLDFAAELFAAANAIETSLQLRNALTDPTATSTSKEQLVDSLFKKQLGTQAISLVRQVVVLRWSKSSDLSAALELLGVRATAASVKSAKDLANELFQVQQLISSDSELELAVGARRLPVELRRNLLETLLSKRVSPATMLLVKQSLSSKLAKRSAQVLSGFADQVAEYAAEQVALISVASPLTDAQLGRLSKALSAKFGRELQLNVVTDPKLIGGVRVSVGGEIIDASVRSRISQARLQLG